MAHNDITLSTLYNSTRTFMKQHPKILITRADKENTVAINKQKYVTQIESILWMVPLMKLWITIR